jgi:hypothetical protein
MGGRPECLTPGFADRCSTSMANQCANWGLALVFPLGLPHASGPAESLLNDLIRLGSECEMLEP